MGDSSLASLVSHLTSEHYFCIMSTPGTFSIRTLGCKLNYAESSTLSRQLESAGWNMAGPDVQADLYILNTCSVTEFADKKCRQAVRRFKRHNPHAKVIVTGCYAQLKPEELDNIEGVDAVLGAAEKFNLLQHVSNLQIGMPTPRVHRQEIEDHGEFHMSYSVGDRTRAFLKVQDGCDYKCSFCTIPRARGLSRSATIDQVIRQASELAEQGIQEVVLTGVNIGDFGLEPDTRRRQSSFLELINELEKVPMSRYRISSIEPNLCTNEIIEFVAGSTRFMPHFHMPLQSGSDDMLKVMRRRYGTDLYADRVAVINQLMPHACIGVDVIVGFHGESDAHFDQTRAFLQELDVAYFHVFTYSERSDTHAMKLEGRVPMKTRKLRNYVLRQLSDKKRHYFYSQHLETRRPVLFEHEKKSKHGITYSTGYTDNYIKVSCPGGVNRSNEIADVDLCEIGPHETMMGTCVEKKAFIQ